MVRVARLGRDRRGPRPRVGWGGWWGARRRLMLFNSSIFAVFLAVVLLGHWTLTGRRARNLLLLGASYLFYGWWDWRFLGLLIGTSTLDYAMGIAIHDATVERQRKVYLWVSCGANVAALVFFKYFNFFSENLRLGLGTLGVQ